MIDLTQSEQGKTIDVRQNEEIAIRLDENPSTGYRWVVEQDGGEILHLLHSDFVQSTGDRIGAGGQRVFTFQALKAGDASLKFKLWRSWEGDRSLKARFAVDVRVKP